MKISKSLMMSFLIQTIFKKTSNYFICEDFSSTSPGIFDHVRLFTNLKVMDYNYINVFSDYF